MTPAKPALDGAIPPGKARCWCYAPAVAPHRAQCYTFERMNPFYKNLALWMVIALVIILLFNLFQQKDSPRDEIVFSDFMKRVDAGEVREVTIRGNAVSGKMQDRKSTRLNSSH